MQRVKSQMPMKSLLVYKASAGSGKTFTLAVEYIKLLIANPYAYRNILAVTFTNKATAEMKVRIIGQLNGIAKRLHQSERYFEKVKNAPEIKKLNFSDEEIRRRAQMALSAMLHDYSRFRITTIDSFFQSIVRELAYELDLTANLRVDLNSKEALAEAVKSIVEDINYYTNDADMQENLKLKGILRDFIFERIDADKAWNILGEIQAFSDNIFKEEYLKQQADVRDNIGDPKVLAQVKARLREVPKAGVEKVKQLGDALYTDMLPLQDDLVKKSTGAIAAVRKAAQMDAHRDFKTTKDALKKMLTDAALGYADGLEGWAKTDATTAKLEELDALRRYRELLSEIGLQMRKITTAQMMLLHINEMMLLNAVNTVLREKNRENNRFILADTAHFLKEMIDEFDVPFIYERTGTRYEHIMIDEFQDTSELQWENFKPLLANSLDNNSRCLIVGDVKQSIYRWRNSDWRTLNDMEYGVFKDKISLPPLDTNYRSSEEVVTFNNNFFKKAARYVSKKYNEDTTFKDKSNANEDRAQAITTAYKEVVQQVPEDHRGYGYVKVEHLAYPAPSGKKKDEAADATPEVAEAEVVKTPKELMLESFGANLRELLDKGVKPKDIAVLVRKNDHGVQIADYLKQEFPDLKVVSNEAFLLDSSLAVNMLILALRTLANPQDDVSRYALAALYHREVVCRGLEGADENSIFSMSKSCVDSLLPLGDEEARRALIEVPLYELCEQLYNTLNLQVIPGQDAYLYCFYDQLLSFLQDNRSTLGAFLEHWDEKMHETSVPKGSAEGLQILTVHKSKGLEFHTVIVPFCEWNATGVRNSGGSLLWCAPKDAPFNDLKLAPVEYVTGMKDSLFDKEFNEELLKQLVDNLNILYVAFTRAENNLIVLTGKKEGKSVGEKIETVSDIINMALVGEEKDGKWIWPAFPSEAKSYEFGELVPSKEKTKTKKVEEVNYLEPKFKKCIQTFQSLPAKVDFRQSNDSFRFLQGDVEDAADDKGQYIEQGNFYHSLLERVQTLDDLPGIIAEFEREGLIAGAEHKREVEEYMHRIFENEQAREWFLPKWRVLNEQNILLPLNAKKDKRYERPDRVICDGQSTIVVDYKTGGTKTLSHLEQVQDYVELLQHMGYPNPTGYVWYLKYNEVVPVSS